MKPTILSTAFLTVFILCGAARVFGDSAQNDPRWSTALKLYASGQYTAAASVLEALFDDYPQSQPVAARFAATLFEAGRYDQCHHVADQTVAINPYSEAWAAQGYLYKARVCRELGCLSETLAAIDILKQRFPEAVATARGEALLAEINGATGVDSEADLVDEYAADQLVTQALKTARTKDYAQAVAMLDDVIGNYAHTRTALYAMERKAYMLSTQSQWTTRAQDAFFDVIAAVQDETPHSRIRYDAEFRVAALYQRQDRPFEAMVTYQNLADIAQDPKTAMEATFQAMGARNEMLQRRDSLGEAASDEEWELLRTECAAVKEAAGATALHISRADLIIAESLHWQHRTEEAFAAADYHIRTHGDSGDRAALATAHLIAGECLQKLDRHADALLHYYWIVDTFGDKEPWGYIGGKLGRTYYPTSLARVRYRICDALLRNEARPEDSAAACQNVLDAFPDSRYADLVRHGWRNEEQ